MGPKTNFFSVILYSTFLHEAKNKCKLFRLIKLLNISIHKILMNNIIKVIPPRVHRENHKIIYQQFLFFQYEEDPGKKKTFLQPCMHKTNRTFFQVSSTVLM